MGTLLRCASSLAGWEFGLDYLRVPEAHGLVAIAAFEPELRAWAHTLGKSVTVNWGASSIIISPTTCNEKNDTAMKADLFAALVADLQRDPDNPHTLIVAEQRLNLPLVRVCLDMLEHPETMSGIISWATQKQVVLTSESDKLKLGESLEETLRYARHDYWLSSDLEDFLRQCRHNLRQDGSNAIEHTYTTFDPTTGDDWVEVKARFRFLDAGRLGLYQAGETLAYRSIPAPVAR